jgi:transcription antitermination factor NusG
VYEDCKCRWLAIQVRPNAERTVLIALDNKGYETFLPTYQSIRKWTDRKKILSHALFPGYLFCRWNQSVRLPIIGTQGVIRILGNGTIPIPVPDSEIASLQTVVTTQDVRCRPWPNVEVGAPVVIQSGPLRGVTGVLRAIQDESFLIVCVSLLQRSVAVKIQAHWVAPEALSSRLRGKPEEASQFGRK